MKVTEEMLIAAVYAHAGVKTLGASRMQAALEAALAVAPKDPDREALVDQIRRLQKAAKRGRSFLDSDYPAPFVQEFDQLLEPGDLYQIGGAA